MYYEFWSLAPHPFAQGGSGMRFYFVRHGESEANVLRVVSNRGSRHGLTGNGREQAHLLADRFANVPIKAMYSSPLLRAVETAGILANRLGVSWDVADALREFDCGDIEGKSDAASWDRHSALLDRWFLQNRFEERFEGGESFEDILARFAPLIERLGCEHGKNDVNLLLVGHGGVYRSMFPVIMSNIDFGYAFANHLDNSGYVLAEWASDRIVCREWNGQAIMDGAGH